MAAFVYPIIDKSKFEIRVLDIHPGVFGEVVFGTLTNIPLQSTEEYEALSYAWGNTTLCRYINVNGSHLSVTENAEVALQHLRRSNNSRRIWIDAICINQLDNHERLQQVQSMREIYEHATCVLIWLGPAFEGSDSALNLLEDLHQKFDLARKSYSSIPTHPFHELPVAPLRALFFILERAYWTRVWILQEVAVNKAEPIIGCGDRWLSWSIWSGALFQIHSYRGLLHQAGSSESRVSLGPDHLQLLRYLPLVDRFQSLDIIRRSATVGRDHFRVMDDELPKSQREETNLLRILDRADSQFASDPKDRIFALLGLIRHHVDSIPLRNVIVPDYSKSVQHVYCEAVKFALENEHTLEILKFRNHLRHPWLPSWAPNFSVEDHCRFPSLAPDSWHTWSASGKLRWPGCTTLQLPKLSDDLKILHLNAKAVDNIDRVLDLTTIWTEPFKIFERIRRFVFPRAFSRKEGTPVSFHVHDALWRTLVGNRSEGNTMPCPSGYRDAYMKLIDIHGHDLRQVGQIETPEIKSFLSAARATISNYAESPHRRLFVTTDGMLGIGTPDCEPGDVVYIIKSYSMPSILRRSLQDHYIFIGSAFVYGIMDGQALGGNFEWISII